MEYRTIICAFLLGIFLTLTGCSGADSVPGVGGVSTNYPYLTSTPVVTFIQNVNILTSYDVTVTLEATGPDPIFSVGLWLYDKNNFSNFAYMDLVYMGGTTWGATTNTWIPLSAGDYYIESIMIEDGDPFANGIVKSGWYTTGIFSSTHYDIDQRETNWDPLNLAILNLNVGVSNIPVVNFTLP